MNSSEVASHLDQLLKVQEIKDYSNAVNGLQVANSGRITKVAAAVDACEAVITRAVEEKADLLIVHHGLFWGGLGPVTGAAYRKLKLAMDHDLAIYSVHLPLDAHPEYGNNALLCEAIGLTGPKEPFLDLGFQASAELAREELMRRVGQAVGGGRVHLAPGGPTVCRRIGVVTGGAGGSIFAAASAGVDTFITGEGPHWSYTAAEEAGINLIYAGHYATETFGVKALARYLESTLGLPWLFLDHPTGL